MSEPRTEPCGCVVTMNRGHTHTKLCEHHKREVFKPRDKSEPDNLDLIGG
jgi:hypothetical protein